MGTARGGEDGRVYKYARGIYARRPYIFVQSRRTPEREQVTQQVAVFTGFPGDETRRPGRRSPTPLPLARGSETAGIATRATPRRAVPTPPLNGRKAPVRNLRVEALTAAVAAGDLIPSPVPLD